MEFNSGQAVNADFLHTGTRLLGERGGLDLVTALRKLLFYTHVECESYELHCWTRHHHRHRCRHHFHIHLQRYHH